MAVMRNSIIFGGVNSADFGIYISGEGVFNAPKRAVEYVQVPGRSGAIAMDLGYYENIEVEYPAFNYEPEMADFIQALRSFRNAICSQTGYQRLNDTFHPDEYRMAVYSEGLEVDPVKFNTASEFTLKFNCKPQRYLLSGESAVDMDSGDSLYNPTPFDASPLLEVEGYGSIEFNGYTIEIDEGFYGIVDVADAGAIPTDTVLQTEMFNDGDTITIKPFAVNCHFGDDTYPFESPQVTNTSGIGTTAYASGSGTKNLHFKTTFAAITFASNTDYSSETKATLKATLNRSPLFSPPQAEDITININYTASAHTVSITVSSAPNPDQLITPETFAFDNPSWNGATADSTKSTMTGTTYIDCDLGDAYKIEDGEYASLNSYIDLGSDLPTLASGANEVTFSNTVTSLKIIPRWWIL
ncbi:MAG: hypothetical protein IIZ78_15485 [Clostridiales bacterium]|nr:hypothetical protein [Clostridiales bacterium]